MLKVGILGGGQLGRMLLQSAANYPVETFVLENDENCPSAHLCHHFTRGDIRKFDDVYRFGKGLDAIAIEIESVNEQALEKLEEEGVAVYPRPAALRIIKNKIAQKEYYRERNIPSPDFVITRSPDEVKQYASFLPAVHKLAEGGYDGRGVQVIRSEKELSKAFPAPSVLEKMVDIYKEIAQIVAIDQQGGITLYPPVEMVFDQELNLLDYQLSPADITDDIKARVEAISLDAVKGLQSAGIFAVELFLDRKQNVYVNEMAPRVHNSGHHTIEGNYSSQFDMLWRIILGYPLGNTAEILPAALVNLLGEPGHNGDADYQGLPEALQRGNVFIHLYGKRQTKPGRKMGHATILGENKETLINEAHALKQIIKIRTKK
ncbi:MAG: 5-(carboxyamino)imidazole ribonucleotide synthase [Chitinophagaceae bacterium]|nr:5-(carboxyamino)imidazole ribonucleotide synthase [Chitinophagaceae bacterium]